MNYEEVKTEQYSKYNQEKHKEDLITKRTVISLSLFILTWFGYTMYVYFNLG